ncbi:hypothetical protein CCMA1212_001047 [Trichoderma ghanense]|uniref:Uncharacterized protein n=1 Tax=Trichoderma ghanense TaxID=65468 RepID=A0ABY2HGY3_9HYPO
MTQSNRVGHDGGTLLQGGTSTRSSSKAGMEWKGVGIRWKGMKSEEKEAEEKEEKRVRENKDMDVPELDGVWREQARANHTEYSRRLSAWGFRGTHGPCMVR